MAQKDENTLPKSSQTPVEKAGINSSGYIDKKRTPSGMSAKFNKLPPGTDIEDQEVADIREQPLKEIVDGKGYPGDGWRG